MSETESRSTMRLLPWIPLRSIQAILGSCLSKMGVLAEDASLMKA